MLPVLFLAMPFGTDVYEYTGWSLKKTLAKHMKESGDAAVNALALNTLLDPPSLPSGHRAPKYKYSKKGKCRHTGQSCVALSPTKEELRGEQAEDCCMLTSRGCTAVHLWNANGNASAPPNELGCLPDHTNRTVLAEDQYSFKERTRQWRTHFVYVFSVYKEWEHYSHAEKENMQQIVANYKKDFDVVVYNKYKDEDEADAWCKTAYPNLCPDHGRYGPNLGWQFGTYLTFVAEYYHNLPNVTIFVEGDGLDRHTTSPYTPYYLRHDMTFTHVNGAGVGVQPHSTWLRKCFEHDDNFFGSEVNQYMAEYLLKLFDVPLEALPAGGKSSDGERGPLCFETWCCSQLAVSKALLLRKPQSVWKQGAFHARLGYHDGYEMIMHAILGGQPAAMPHWSTEDWCKQFYKCNDRRSEPYRLGKEKLSDFQCDGGGSEYEGEISPCYGKGRLGK
jgi:hypothetical protein